MLVELAFTLLLVIAYFVTTAALARLLKSVGESKEAAPQRAIYISKVLNFGVLILASIILTLIWGVDYASVFVLASSILAVIGIAFFAQWSILSNVTASIVIFFSYPSRIGDRVRVLDGDNTLEGEIKDINLFQVLIEDTHGNVVNYPNNLIIQRPLVKLNSNAPPADSAADTPAAPGNPPQP